MVHIAGASWTAMVVGDWELVASGANGSGKRMKIYEVETLELIASSSSLVSDPP